MQSSGLSPLSSKKTHWSLKMADQQVRSGRIKWWALLCPQKRLWVPDNQSVKFQIDRQVRALKHNFKMEAVSAILFFNMAPILGDAPTTL